MHLAVHVGLHEPVVIELAPDATWGDVVESACCGHDGPWPFPPSYAAAVAGATEEVSRRASLEGVCVAAGGGGCGGGGSSPPLADGAALGDAVAASPVESGDAVTLQLNARGRARARLAADAAGEPSAVSGALGGRLRSAACAGDAELVAVVLATGDVTRRELVGYLLERFGWDAPGVVRLIALAAPGLAAVVWPRLDPAEAATAEAGTVALYLELADAAGASPEQVWAGLHRCVPKLRHEEDLAAVAEWMGAPARARLGGMASLAGLTTQLLKEAAGRPSAALFCAVLRTKGADPRTAVVWAAAAANHGRPKAAFLRPLLARMREVDAAGVAREVMTGDDRGRTPATLLFLCDDVTGAATEEAAQACAEALACLLEAAPGAGCSADISGRTTLHLACGCDPRRSGFVECVQLLLRDGADSRRQDVSGATAIDVAVRAAEKFGGCGSIVGLLGA